jgi:hypothetical protein
VSFLRRLLGREPDGPDASGARAGATEPDDDQGAGPGLDPFADQHRVTVWLRLADPELLDAREQALAFGIEDAIMRRLYESGAGEHDTNELERGYLALRLAGPDADAIVALVTPLLERARPGSYLAVRRGPTGTGEERLDVEVSPRDPR